MLSELYIENLAVIKQATIPFSNNLNVFTGETGAGKSILINGINAVLGRRTYKDIVRSGCEKAVISAMFTDLSVYTKAKLDELSIDYSDNELLISREIYADGGSSARVNSKPANISSVREIGATLIDIHGQHDNQILMYPEKHLEIIDNYSGLEKNVAEYNEIFKKLQDTARNLKKLTADIQNKNARMDILKNIINDIGSLEIDDENEDTMLNDEYALANNSSTISNTIIEADVLLSGNDDISGVCETLDNIINKLSLHVDLLPEFNEIAKRLENSRIEISDISGELIKINDTIDIDAERFAYIQNRREQLNSVKRKYGPELKDVMAVYKNAVLEAETIVNSSEELEKLNKEKNALLVDVTNKAEALSELRIKASQELVIKIESELHFLDMPNVQFVFEHNAGKLTSTGMDSFQMLLSVNKGEDPKPIAKIASGGELSRIMLAIKNVIAEKDDVPTLIFDEIDTGVSGRAAQKIGVKLRQTSKFRQVLCVTHLSQIAVMADNHLLIQKDTVDDKTETTVKKLDMDERKYEIARILSGEHITETSLQNAEEQLLSRDEVCDELLKRYSD